MRTIIHPVRVSCGHVGLGYDCDDIGEFFGVERGASHKETINIRLANELVRVL